MEITTDTYNFLNLLVSIASLILTVIGLIFVYFQVTKLKHPIWNATHAALFSQSLELLKFLNEKPFSYYCFYDNKELPEGEEDRIYIQYAAEALANFMEQLLMQEKYLPQQQWEVWEKYIKTSLDCSIVLKNFILSRKDWYSPSLVKRVEASKTSHNHG